MDSHPQINPVNAITAQERQRLVRLAYHFCWNPADAEDALHNALLAATQKSDQLRDRSKRWSWLCRIVIQHCHLLGRSQQRQSSAVARLGEQQREPESPTEQLDHQGLGELMRRLLKELPQQQRVAMTLRHLEKLEYPRIADIMGVGESTVRAHVRAGRDALRRLILARYPEWQA